MSTILIIDDEVTLRNLMARVIQLEGYQVLEAATAKEGMHVLHRESIQVVITDVKLPDGNGVELTAKIKAEFPAVEVIVLTAYGTIADGVRAIKNGAFDYLTKGEHQEKIIPLLSKASEKAALQQRVVNLESRLEKKFGFPNIVGKSKQVLQSIDLARKVAGSDAHVLLLGETGSGKEVFARAIHYESKRKSKPFVGLNCSAFPKELLESELFGHAEGAFTGATRSKKGLVEEAQEGTLFLDEIGEIHADLQAKLLRFVETREFYRVGETRPRKVDARLVAATNRSLEKEVEAGHFREDLFYRLSVFTISLPPLRERAEDIPLLAAHFAKEVSAKLNRPGVKMHASFIKALQNHPWKGNIRELRNVIERSLILSEKDELMAEILPEDFNMDPSGTALDLASAEKAHIRKVLALTGGNKTQAAKILDIGLTTLYQKIKDFGL